MSDSTVFILCEVSIQEPVPGSRSVERAKKDDSREARERKNKGDWRKGGRTSRHCFKNLIPVYQPLVYPPIGQFRQFTSTLRIHVNHTAESNTGRHICYPSSADCARLTLFTGLGNCMYSRFLNFIQGQKGRKESALFT